MSEELYNSRDFCLLAEECEELKKENAELARDKDYLMNLFMERSEYVFNVVANMKIESLTQKCKAFEADYIISNRELLILQAEIDRLKDLNKRLKEDAERLENIAYIYSLGGKCNGCDLSGKVSKENVWGHTPDCPITLHRALMAEMEEK